MQYHFHIHLHLSLLLLPYSDNSNMGQFYNITVYFKKGNKTVHKVTFIDSLKIIPFSVDDTAKAFKLPISKLKLDMDSVEKQMSNVMDRLSDVVIKSDLADMMNSFVDDEDNGVIIYDTNHSFNRRL